MASYQLDKYIRHLLDAHSACVLLLHSFHVDIFGPSKNWQPIENKQIQTREKHTKHHPFTDADTRIQILVIWASFYFNNACLIKYTFLCIAVRTCVVSCNFHSFSCWLFAVCLPACLPVSQSVCFDTQLQASKCHVFCC